MPDSTETPTQPYDRAVEAAALSYSTPEGVADAVLTAALGDRDQIAHMIPAAESSAPEVTAAVEKAARDLSAWVREIQAKALEEAAVEALGIGVWSGMQIDVGRRAASWLGKRAANLRTTDVVWQGDGVRAVASGVVAVDDGEDDL